MVPSAFRAGGLRRTGHTQEKEYRACPMLLRNKLWWRGVDMILGFLGGPGKTPVGLVAPNLTLFR